MTSADRDATRTLLAERHRGSSRFDDGAWLRWLYDDNPAGPAIESDHDGGGRRLGHVGLVPQRWRRGDERIGMVLAVNVVTSAASRAPLFAQLLGEGLARAFTTAGGASGAWGVTNEASTATTRRDVPAHQVRALPVLLARSRRPDGVRSTAVDREALGPSWVRSVTGDLRPPAAPWWRQAWTPELLAWRLGAPGQGYALHVSEAAVAVSTTVRWRVPVGVVVKLLPRRGPVDGDDVRRLVGAVRRHHRVGPVVYAGFNRLAPVPGIGVPRRLRPAALNLFVMGGDDARRLGIRQSGHHPFVPTHDLVLEACELLDFDAL